MDRVLIIGGCGGLGFHIVKQLRDQDPARTVAAFDISVARNIVPDVTYIKGDLSSPIDVRAALQQIKPSVIFHTASPMLMAQKSDEQLFTRVNIHGTRVLLDEIRTIQCVHALVYTSSSSVVHDNQTDLVNATEDMPKCYLPEQTEFYTHTKAVAEDMVFEANRKNGLLTVAIRGVCLFGEGDQTTIPNMVASALSGRSKMQVGDGTNLWDLTYLGNTAHGHILAAQALTRISASEPPPPDRVDGEAFVITNDEPVPFWSFIRSVAAAAGHPVADKDVRVVPVWLFYAIAVMAEWAVWISSFGTREASINRKMVKYLTMTRTFDITKAKQRLGYRPLFNQGEAIKRSVEAFIAAETEGKKAV
jgi:sterol-4alpha-carboxylate 3-dehydrogenase (decarboxylating)